jgi:hypothetical protein
VYLTAIEVGKSALGAFRLFTACLSCRAGVRGRGLLVGAVTDSAEAGRMLESRWGLRANPGSATIERDAGSVRVQVANRRRPCIEMRVPDTNEILPADVVWPTSLHPARVASGGGPDRPLLVQFDPGFEVRAAWRGRPAIALGPGADAVLQDVVPLSPIAARVFEGTIRLPEIRFVVDPDAPLASGTRRADRG